MICRPCSAGFHEVCKDLDPGTPCPCQCPDDTVKQLRAARRRVAHHQKALREAQEEVAALTGGYSIPAPRPTPPSPSAEDLLEQYRRPDDRRLGRQRLEAATKELYAP